MRIVQLQSESGNIYNMDVSDLLSADGAMSKIYSGEKLLKSGEGKKVAIKVLRKEFKYQPMFLERFKRESSIRFSHQNVVEIYDYIEDKKSNQNSTQYAIAMEFLEGESVKEKLDRLKEEGKVFKEKEVLKIAKQVLQGLRALHMQYEPIYHRDVKPGNIMLCKDGVVKIIDFGISKVKDKAADKTLTRIGMKIRTPLYAAPEQVISGGIVGAWTDTYALGICCYEMLTGKPPYNSEDDVELERFIIGKNIVPHPKIKNKRVFDMLKKATAKNPEARYRDAIEFIQSIDEILYDNIERKDGRTFGLRSLSIASYNKYLLWSLVSSVVIAIAVIVYLLISQNG